MWAAHRGCVGAVQVLIDAGAELNHKNPGNYTALMLAEFKRYSSVVKLLKSAGAQE
jgi:hypothetical protein